MDWIGVEDRLPDINRTVLGFNGRCVIKVTPCGFYSPKLWIEEDYHIGDYITLDITHWMPLPKPPTTNP